VGQVLTKVTAADYNTAWQTPAAGLTIPLSQNLTWAADNTYDIGANGSGRPGNLYVANGTYVRTNLDVGSTSGGQTYGVRLRRWSDGAVMPVATNPDSQDTLQIGGGNINTMRLATDGGLVEQRGEYSNVPQTLRIYNTYTSANDYERGKLGWTANQLQLKTESAGSGTARAVAVNSAEHLYLSASVHTYVDTNLLYLRTQGGLYMSIGGTYYFQGLSTGWHPYTDNTVDLGVSNTRWRAVWAGSVNASAGVTLTGGNLNFNPDNTLDIGPAGNTRPRNVYLGGTLNVGPLSNLGVLRTYTNNATFSLEAPASYLMAGSKTGSHWSCNTYYDGTNWQTWDTAQPSSTLIVQPAALTWRTQAANVPGTSTVRFSVDSNGSGTFAGNLTAVGNSIIVGNTAQSVANGADWQSTGALIAGNGFFFLGSAKDLMLRRDSPNNGWWNFSGIVSFGNRVKFPDGGVVGYRGQYQGNPVASGTTSWFIAATLAITARGLSGDILIVHAKAPIRHSANNANFHIGIFVDGGQQTYTMCCAPVANLPVEATASFAVSGLSPGAHTIQLQFYVVTTGTLTVDTGSYTSITAYEILAG